MRYKDWRHDAVLGFKNANHVFVASTGFADLGIGLSLGVPALHTFELLHIVLVVQHDGIEGVTLWTGGAGNETFFVLFVHG